MRPKKKRLVIPATLTVLTIAAACSSEPQPEPNDPCLELGQDCASLLGPDGGPVFLPDGGARECVC